ncbi:MAG: hypothetical protein VX642_09170 [Bdellovibrionota bacterium]|nr:hypothetical protein [Bdellovibrionota bacterium]
MKFIQILFLILMAACADEGNESSRDYPFLDYSQKKIDGFQNTRSMISAITNKDESYIESVYSSILELVPYPFSEGEQLEIGKLERTNYQEESRVSFNVMVAESLKVKIEIHKSSELYQPFEYIRVIAYQDGYSYIRLYLKEEIYQESGSGI